MGVGLVSIATRLTGGLRSVAVAVILGLLASYGMTFARDHSIFSVQEGERKYVAMGQYIGRRLPERAAFLCMQHSGSIRYYSGRLTIRYDWIPPERFEATVTHLRQRGYTPFLLIDDAEEAEFKDRFSDSSAVKPLGTPQVRFPKVSLYRL